MSGENQRLREALNQVMFNCNTLEMHLEKMIQQNRGDEKRGGSAIVPRPSIDLALAAPTMAESDENSESSEEERRRDEHSRSPINKNGAIERVQRLNDKSNEGTIQKARVSVRVRSEASVVLIEKNLISFRKFNSPYDDSLMNRFVCSN